MTTSTLRRFFHNPFETLDKLDLNIYGFQLNILRDDLKLREVLTILPVGICLTAHFLLGSDSTMEQVAFFIWNIPGFLIGKISFDQLTHTFSDYYGLGTHWSAGVIYGLMFIGLSKYLRENLECINSENLCLTTGFVGLAIATFEFFWMGSYYLFQNQKWILSLAFPQFRIILQNILFTIPATIIISGILIEKQYKFNLSRRTKMFFIITILCVLTWWFYPFNVEQLVIYIQGYGLWISSKLFPQTMYTIDLNLLDNIAVGEMFYVGNSAVHFTNNITKIFWTLTFYELFKIRKIKKDE